MFDNAERREKNPMKKDANLIQSILTGLATAAIVLVAVHLGGVVCKKAGQKPNPYEYNLDDFRKVDPKWMTYQETGRIDIPARVLYALAADLDGHIIVSGDHALFIFNLEGQPVSRIDLGEPARCIAASPEGRFYLGMIDHVEVFDDEGKRVDAWDRLDETALLTSIAVGENDVFVADAGHKVVLRYDLSGNVVGRLGDSISANDGKGLVIPSPYFDVAIGYEGHLWMTNTGRHRIENYTRDGRFRSSWGKASWGIRGFCGCCNPTHIVILPDGRFVTSEKGLPRVKVYDQTGNLEAVIAGPEQFEEGTIGLDLAVDSSGRILVLDPKKRSVRIFQQKSMTKP
jgi:hypothetical protein